MRTSLAVALGLVSLLLAAPRVRATVSAGDCERWLAQLEGETTKLPLPRDQSAERDEMLRRLAHGRQGNPSDAVKDMTEFKKHAAKLAARGAVPKVEGQRLDQLAETVRRCYERAAHDAQ